MPQIIFMPSGRRGQLPNGITVLEAARQLGVDIESICGGRLTCNKCLVQVENGRFPKHAITSSPTSLSPATEAESRHLQKLNAHDDCRLACAATLHKDALIFVPETSRAHKQIIRKDATQRLIDIDPAVRQVYVEVETAVLGQHTDDWSRLQAALAARWHLTHLTIDLHPLQKLQPALRQGNWAVTVTLWQNSRVIDVQPGYQEGVYGLAVDIGSTTLAAFLCDLRTGEILATESAMNPQVTFGEDLMSRISFTMMHKDGLNRLHNAIIDALNRLAAAAARTANRHARHIHEAVLVGNTTMIHLLLGIDPVELGGAPFTLARRDAIDLPARDLGLRLHPAANVHILPAQAGHVGADNVAALLAEAPHQQTAVTLLVDVGTNAELVLGSSRQLFSASSPTGPAFEGAQIRHGMRAAPGAIERVRIDPATGRARFRVIGEPRWSDEWSLGSEAAAEAQPRHLATGICGSGIIETIGELFLAGLVQADGRFSPTHPSSFLVRNGRTAHYILAPASHSATGEPIIITQDDIRAIQLAKAALYAGAKLLMQAAEIDKVERVVLAGAFGSYIDPRYAMILGMIPDCALAHVTAVGNAAGDGARIALLNRQQRQAAQTLASQVNYVETAVHPHFQDEFVAAIHLPHARDDFPHLSGVLPAAPAAPDAARPRSRRRMRKNDSPRP